jgi:hypothetical protein
VFEDGIVKVTNTYESYFLIKIVAIILSCVVHYLLCVHVYKYIAKRQYIMAGSQKVKLTSHQNM